MNRETRTADATAEGGGVLIELGVTRERAEQWLGAALKRIAEEKRQAAG